MKFNIRVYGLLVVDGKVLVSDENRFGHQFTKFPGGGLEFQEGVIDCLYREFQEELNIEIKNPSLFHINEDFIKSAFHKDDQIISIYYKVESNMLDRIDLKETRFDFKGNEQIFRLVQLSDLNESNFRFPIDKVVVQKLIQD